MCGLRPIIELMSWSFSFVAFDQIVNNAANVRYMSGGQFKVPIVFRGGNGIAHQLGQRTAIGWMRCTAGCRDWWWWRRQIRTMPKGLLKSASVRRPGDVPGVGTDAGRQGRSAGRGISGADGPGGHQAQRRGCDADLLGKMVKLCLNAAGSWRSRMGLARR